MPNVYSFRFSILDGGNLRIDAGSDNPACPKVILRTNDDYEFRNGTMSLHPQLNVDEDVLMGLEDYKIQLVLDENRNLVVIKQTSHFGLAPVPYETSSTGMAVFPRISNDTNVDETSWEDTIPIETRKLPPIVPYVPASNYHPCR
jgi:hypothetical protein